MHESTIIQRALLTVYDKTHIVTLAERLHLRGVELISTGNTAKLLQAHGLPVIAVGDYTGFPEMMDGRVKTLHPKIHGGILGRRDVDADIMIEHHIPDIDLVVVNLYPFQQVIQNPQHTLEEAIENIDIGGPTLLRGAAKNYTWCSVLVDPKDYASFLDELENDHGTITEKTRFYLAKKAFAHTAAYDASVAHYLSSVSEQGTPETSNLFPDPMIAAYTRKSVLRYGENPHQQAAFYETDDAPSDSLAKATVLQGKALSYNNIVDADTALSCVQQFTDTACVIVKHANPSGVALSSDVLGAYDKAYRCDPIAAFGGIIAFNQPVSENVMQHILNQQFVEIIVAPEFTDGALRVAQSKPNCRLIQYQKTYQKAAMPEFELRSVRGGLLVQTWDEDTHAAFEVVTEKTPSAQMQQDLIFSWKVAKFVKSNAIVFAKDGCTLAIGAGQMSRIFSTEIAALKAKEHHFDLKGAVMASDAFFPFKDNVEKASELGIAAIIQPGGSIKDSEVISCANALGVAMIFTQLRHFRH